MQKCKDHTYTCTYMARILNTQTQVRYSSALTCMRNANTCRMCNTELRKRQLPFHLLSHAMPLTKCKCVCGKFIAWNITKIRYTKQM